MKNENMIKLAEEMVQYGKKQGAGQVEVSIGSGENFEVQIMNGEVEKLNQAGSKRFSVKVIVDSKVANASSSDFRGDTLKKLIDNAIARAKLTSPDPFSDLPEKETLTVDINSLKLFDNNIIELAPEKKIQFAKEIERIGLADKRIKVSAGSYYGTNHSETIIVNSNGFSGSYESTSCFAGGGFQSGDGDNLVEDYWSENSTNLAELKSAEEIANTAIQRVVRMIGARKIPSQAVPIVFEPNMTAMLLGFLSHCIMGGAIYMNRSFLIGKIGEKIANGNVNIFDDGLMPGRMGTQPFDSEGVPSRENPVIENGKLVGFLNDRLSAKIMNEKPNGHGRRESYQHIPIPRMNNTVLGKGNSDPDEIIASVKKGFYAVSYQGGQVSNTGKFTFSCNLAYMIEDGKLTQPVKNATLIGTNVQILNEISMVGSDTAFFLGSCGKEGQTVEVTCGTPTLKIDKMTVGGAA